MELWKVIDDFPSYEVSNLGRVRNLKTKRVRKAVKHHSGYLQLNLVQEDKSKKVVSIHRLVAFAFCNPPDNWKDLTVNHKDGIKENVEATNLEWVSLEDNLKHARDTFLNIVKGSSNGRSKLTEEDVLKIRGYYDNSLLSQKELAIMYKVSKATINLIVNRKTWKHI